MALFRSLRFRLTLWYIALLALTLAAFSAGVYFAMRASLYSNLDDSLDSRAEILSRLIMRDGGLDTGSLDPASAGDEEFVRIFTPEGDLVFSDLSAGDGPPADATAVAAALAGRESRRSEYNGDEHLRVLTAPVTENGTVVGAIEIGLTEDDLRESLSSLLLIIVIAYPLALVVTAGGGILLANRALRPIDRITRAARRIGAEDLSQRLNLKLPDDEVGRLARTFDEMIARLEDSFLRQRQFTADASHELRTPLTAIKGQAEVALQREREPDDYREALRVINGQVDRMIRLVASLLTLARADAGTTSIKRERISIGSVIDDAVGHVRTAAGDDGVSIEAQAADGLAVTGDRDLVLQLLLNLLDNAVKYSAGRGLVRISSRTANGSAEITVEDTGPGIPPEHLPYVFDRFYRVDDARSRSAGGAGLGLSISRWIAEAHGGTLRVASTPGQGAVFTLTLPLA
jgi:heavy metal sensor kinase